MKLKQLSTITSFTVLADGLDNPKGLTFAPDGSLYITETGTGGKGASVLSASGQGNLYYGTSGAVIKIENGIIKRILTGLPSLAFPDGTGAAGAHDIKFDASGKPYVLIGYAANPSARDTTLSDTDLGKVIAPDFDTNSWTTVADISGYELANNPDGDEIVSNPLALLIDQDNIAIVDAGANDLLRVGTDGKHLKDIAVLPKLLLTNPVFPGSQSQVFDKGHVPPADAYRQTPSQLPIQQVPTSVTKGPDGAYYISTFTGFPFPEGQAKVYRLDSDGQLTVYADGFTQLIDLTFDEEGNLYVLQFANQSGWKGKFDGSLIKVSPDGTRTNLLSGHGLEAPSAMTIGSDGAFYILNRGGRPKQGQVIRIECSESVSQPVSSPSLLIGC
ncbi:MAG: ScyD/ScyE family protein [Scytonema sp. PMC 1069.18]|nr:ScyD/ScyE family protein [Scytonema sp. PMC 1069.18]MEC4883761.1 ScyD/ScyE family protein [Scytonema sp. PMC 1070.18]